MIADPVRLTVVGVRISHPDRLIYPDLGISKIQLARYYEEIATASNRPVGEVLDGRSRNSGRFVRGGPGSVTRRSAVTGE